MVDYLGNSLNKEEAYFARIEFERRQKIAEENRARLQEQQREELKKLHWMRCPKDGMELVEIELMGIHLDKCTHCGGIFFDGGELDTLLESTKRPDGVLGRVLEIFR